MFYDDIYLLFEDDNKQNQDQATKIIEIMTNFAKDNLKKLESKYPSANEFYTKILNSLKEFAKGNIGDIKSHLESLHKKFEASYDENCTNAENKDKGCADMQSTMIKLRNLINNLGNLKSEKLQQLQVQNEKIRKVMFAAGFALLLGLILYKGVFKLKLLRPIKGIKTLLAIVIGKIQKPGIIKILAY